MVDGLSQQGRGSPALQRGRAQSHSLDTFTWHLVGRSGDGTLSKWPSQHSPGPRPSPARHLQREAGPGRLALPPSSGDSLHPPSSQQSVCFC